MFRRRRSTFLFAAMTLAQLWPVCTSQIATLYSTVLEKNAVEFAVAYINLQQLILDPLSSSLTTINISEVSSTETSASRENPVCDILANVSGLVVPKLTQLSYEVIENIRHLPTTVGQNVLTNIATSDDTIIWRSTTSELLNVIHSFLVHICPTVVVLVESTDNVTISLSSVLPNKLVLSDNAAADIIIVNYSAIENLTERIESAVINASLVADASANVNASCARRQSQSGTVFILNSPVHDVNTILTKVYPTDMEYRWLLLSHITSYLHDVITTSELSWPSPAIIEGLQEDSLFTQEFIDFQNHWLSANKTMFPYSSVDTTEFAYDVFKATLTLLNTVTTSSIDQATFNCSSLNTSDSHNTMSVNSSPANDSTPISHRNYTVWNITTTNLVKFGRWSSHLGFEEISDNGCLELQPRPGESLIDVQFQNNYTGLYFNIVTIQEVPFVMRNPATGEFEGYCIDLLKRLADMMGFNYTLYEVEDRSFGTQVDGEWNGIVRDIMQERANLSVASLTISSERITSVDFTKPFIELGTSILLYKDPEEGFSQTRFARPFSVQLSVVFVISWLIVGMFTWVTTWLSPYDRRALKREKKIDAPYGFSYSMWAQYGSMMQQGSEYHPLSVASRTIVVTWWFVILVLVSSYTAQLAASLTTESIAREINSINDLTDQDYVQYGTVNNSEVQQFFISSSITTYRSALPTIRNNLHPTVDAAVDEVCRSKGTFAFIWDSIVIQTLLSAAEGCGLCSAGSLFDRKGYGIAFPFNSKYTNDFTIAILKLRESHFLLTLRNKWIPTPDDSKCEEFSTLSYNITNIGDAFVILAICLVVSFIVLLIEVIWKHYNISQKIKERGLKWKDQIRKWQYRSRRTTPSNDRHDRESTTATDDEIVNGVVPTAAEQPNGQSPVNIFIKHKQSSQELA